MTKKRPLGGDLDWYLIPIDKVKKAGLAILILGLSVVGIYVATNYFQSPKTRARLAIRDAQKMADKVAQLSDFSKLKKTYVAIQELIQQSQQKYNTSDFSGARSLAREAASKASALLMRGNGGRAPDAKIMRLEGDVELQRSGQGDWESAKPRDDLFEGDFVKTGKNGAAEITIGNIILKLSSDTLYEVTSKKVTGPSGKSKIRMVTGEVNIFTQRSETQVETPIMSADLNPQTVAEIKTGSRKGTATILQGRGGKIRVGNQETELGSLERVNIVGNRITERSEVLAEPQVLSPPDNRTFSITSRLGIKLEWVPVEGAVRYRVQISKTSFFTKMLKGGDFKRTETHAMLEFNMVGSYYWRVAAIGTNGQMGVWSSPRRFRVLQPSDIQGGTTVKPPQLTVQSVDALGRLCVVKGVVESGAQVEVNGERAEVKSDGSFNLILTADHLGKYMINVKATNSQGGETVVRRQVLIEED